MTQGLPTRSATRFRPRYAILTGILWIAATVALVGGTGRGQASFDFVPTFSPYNLSVGSAGAHGWSTGTVISITEGFSSWNNWTGTSKLVYQYNSSACGAWRS